jgi:hypothetical protein
MHARIGTLILLALLMLLPPQAVTGQSGIIVNNASSVWGTDFALSQGLVSNTSFRGTRVLVEYADSATPYPLSDIPAAFRALVSAVPARIIVEYADSSRPLSLAYPRQLINDSQPPVISQVAAGGANTVTWTTDEYADSVVLFGTAPGADTGSASDPLYVRQHRVVLPGLVTGATYYFRATSTDRSGNVASSLEFSLTGQVLAYLPLVIKTR